MTATRHAADPSQNGHGVAPHDLDAEESLLGAMLLDRVAAQAGVEMVEASSFYKPADGLIFGAVRNLVSQGRGVDVVTVKAELGSLGVLDQIGDGSTLLSLTVSTPGTRNVQQYAQIITDHARHRRRLHLALEVANAARAGDEDRARRMGGEAGRARCRPAAAR